MTTTKIPMLIATLDYGSRAERLTAERGVAVGNCSIGRPTPPMQEHDGGVDQQAQRQVLRTRIAT